MFKGEEHVNKYWHMLTYSCFIYISLLCGYKMGLSVHVDNLTRVSAECKAGKNQLSYVAFTSVGVPRCFLESTEYPHRAKGYTIVSNYIEEPYE